MSRRKIAVRLAPVVAALAAGDDHDELTASILDAATTLLGEYGLRRWTIDDVADRAGIGRTSVYRRFPSRDDVVHAVLARELRRTLGLVQEAAARHRSLEDQVVAAVVVCLTQLRASVVDRLLRSDPDTFLPFLTTGAGPLVAIARDAIASRLLAHDPGLTGEQAAVVAEAGARLGLSFVLTRDTVLPADDPEAAAAAIRRLVRPVLRSRS